ncbi:PcfJ domain-containing protein [Agromyces sp. NPDC057679]|uniref:PcfJ domain-containing protein n=1 Tax=Agromyces sp. NPDC057679 TaxID=3346207 RepID=UPI0036717156
MNEHHWVERRTFLSDHAMIRELYDKVSLSRVQVTSGINAHSKKPYTSYRYTSHTHISIRPLKNGTRVLRIHQWKPKHKARGGIWRTVTAERYLDVTSEVRDAVQRMWERVIGPVDPRVMKLASNPDFVRALAYPYLLNFTDDTGSRLKYLPEFGLGKAFRQDNPKAVTVELFGRRNTRKDLVKAVAGADPAALVFAHEAKRHVPIDWVVEMLRANRIRQGKWEMLDVAPAVKVLKMMPDHRRRPLLLDATDVTLHEARDTIRMVDEAREHLGNPTWIGDPILAAKTWTEIHDAAVRERRRITSIKTNVDIPQGPIHSAIDGLTAGELTITTAKDTLTLEHWGDEMHHCIGSYHGHAAAGRSILAAVHNQNGKLIANLELDRDGRPMQLRGKYNANLPDEQDVAVLNAVVDAVKRARRVKPMKVRRLAAAAA